METLTTPGLSELIAQAKQGAQDAREQLLRTFAFVPEEKLKWSPSPSARTALQIVSHCGMANYAFATILRGEEMPMPASPAEANAQIRAAGSDVATREEAVALVENSTVEVLQALDQVTAEMLETTPQSPFGPFPFAFWMQLPGEHMKAHAPQIDYLQTIWGDLENH
jgi:uncharacterized damage-inducible protein DinB